LGIKTPNQNLHCHGWLQTIMISFLHEFHFHHDAGYCIAILLSWLLLSLVSISGNFLFVAESSGIVSRQFC